MDAEATILNVLEGTASFDFNMVMYIFGAGLAILWFFVTVWVWMDSGERSSSLVFRIFSTVLVLPFNLLGLFVYMIIRPKETIEDIFWADLERRYLLYQTEELVDCDRCGYLLRPGFNSCPNCGNTIKHECPGCKVMIDTDFKFCPFCNTQQRKRAVRGEELTREVIQERVEKTDVQVKEAVTSGGTRYKKQGISMIESLGQKAIYVTKRLKKGLAVTFSGAKSAASTRAAAMKDSAISATQSVTADNPKETVSTESVQKNTNTQKKKKKNKKKKK